jgi:hypothetical protein
MVTTDTANQAGLLLAGGQLMLSKQN